MSDNIDEMRQLTKDMMLILYVSLLHMEPMTRTEVLHEERALEQYHNNAWFKHRVDMAVHYLQRREDNRCNPQ